MSEWKLFRNHALETYPTTKGWYYVTLKFNHPSSFVPSEEIKLIGIAYWTNDRMSPNEFKTLSEQDGGLMTSAQIITDDVIAYKPMEFPFPATDKEIAELTKELLKQSEEYEVEDEDEDDAFSIEEVVVSE